MKRTPNVVTLVILISCLGVGAYYFRFLLGLSLPTPEAITIGTAPLESSALVYIAEDQGLFLNNGLSVTIRDYETGANAFAGLIKGEVEIAIPAEYPLIGSAFKKEGARAIASIDKAQYFYLIGRKDRAIEKVSDLRGKNIGVVQKTIAEFYLGRFLSLNGMDTSQLTLVGVDPQKSEDALLNGEVDAIVARPPHFNAIEKRLGANGVIWRVQSSQSLYAIMVGRADWIAERSEAVNRLLRSLAQAEQYAIKNSAGARGIVQRRLGFDDAYMTRVWSENQFSLSLDKSLILAMEDEARWMISNDLTNEDQVPNFLDYLSEAPLKSVKPESVNITR